jgi:hypothetical protein
MEVEADIFQTLEGRTQYLPMMQLDMLCQVPRRLNSALQT